MAGIEPGGFLGIGGGGMVEGDAAFGLQGLHQLAAFGVMGPEAAHMQEYPLWRCRPPGCRVAKEAGGQAAHGYVQACLYLAQQGWIEGEHHGVVGLTRLISGQGVQGRRAVMEITAGQQARAWPLPHPLERTGAHQERVAVVQQHAAAGPTAAVEACAQGLDGGLAELQGIGTIRQLGAGLDQPWLLPERLVGAVVNQADGHGHAAILGAWALAPPQAVKLAIAVAAREGWSVGESPSIDPASPSPMQILNTLTVLALVVMSFALIVAVPVLYASNEDSGRSNRLILLGGIAWVALVLLNWGVSYFVV